MHVHADSSYLNMYSHSLDCLLQLYNWVNFKFEIMYIHLVVYCRDIYFLEQTPDDIRESMCIIHIYSNLNILRTTNEPRQTDETFPQSNCWHGKYHLWASPMIVMMIINASCDWLINSLLYSMNDYTWQSFRNGQNYWDLETKTYWTNCWYWPFALAGCFICRYWKN